MRFRHLPAHKRIPLRTIEILAFYMLGLIGIAGGLAFAIHHGESRAVAVQSCR